MHEMAVMENLLGVIHEQAKAHHLKRIQKVGLVVGALSGAVPDALAFCWEIAVQDTLCRDAELKIKTVAGQAICTRCARHFTLTNQYACPDCGGGIKSIIAGRELYLDYIEGE